MSKQFFVLFLVLAMVAALGLAVACGDDDDDDDDNDTAADDDDDDNDTGDDDATPGDDDDDNDDDTAPPLAEMSFASYNVGLAYGYVAQADERREALFAAVPELDVNALCLQEVWRDEDIDDMTEALATAYPFVFRHDSKADFADAPPEAEARCDDLTALDACVRANCDISENEGLLDCVIESCPIQLLFTGFDCIECLAGRIDQLYEDIIDYCTVPSPPPLAYEGSNGLLLLSDHEMTETDWLQLDHFLNVRVALHAKVVTETGPVHLFCTHLTAAISILPYNGDYASYEAEQAAQIAALQAWVADQAGDEPVVLMGDFNNGPGVAGTPAEFPANYQGIIGAGYADPYTDELPGECTFCDGNPLVGGEGPGGVIIDHLFFDGFAAPAFSAQRLFDEPITLEVDGNDVETRLSDHYGIKVTMTTEP
jgi:Endonuclease/Exonuclease/phosphatase family